MPREFKFPDVGEGITEGEIIRWLVQEGDSIAEDEPLVEIETDKAVVTLPSPYAGIVLAVNGKPSDIIPVGAVLAVIGDPAEAATAPAPPKRSPTSDKGSVVGMLEEAPEDVEGRPVESVEPLATPAVRNLARQLGVSLTQIKGTGPGGRITKEAVEQFALGESRHRPIGTTEEMAGVVEEVPLRGIRRASARRVAESVSRAAAVSFFDDADVTHLEDVRQRQRSVAEAKGFKLTYLPFIIKAVIVALKQYPYLNATLDESRGVIQLKKFYNIGIAIDTPDGLMVFVIREADKQSILDLAQAMHRLGEKAAKRTIALSELKGSTFTITNYGVIGGVYGTPIINYPEAGILGIGKIGDRAVVKEGRVIARRILPLSLTFDHRIVHGAEAAHFMNSIIQHLEDPDLMLIKGK